MTDIRSSFLIITGDEAGTSFGTFRPILLPFVVICYFELPHQCPAGIKKGLSK
jgi:hypothetical protein